MIIIFDEAVWVRMVLVRLMPHGHGYAINGQDKCIRMESVFVFHHNNEWIT